MTFRGVGATLGLQGREVSLKARPVQAPLVFFSVAFCLGLSALTGYTLVPGQL